MSYQNRKFSTYSLKLCLIFTDFYEYKISRPYKVLHGEVTFKGFSYFSQLMFSVIAFFKIHNILSYYVGLK